MKIPQDFKKAIKAVFYDKELEVYSDQVSTDSKGFVKKNPATVVGSFKANVSTMPSSRQDILSFQKQYGMDDDIDLVISTDYEINEGRIIGYRGLKYILVAVHVRDSHNLLFAKKWSLK